MEWYNGGVWKPLTNIQALVNYQRLTSFQYMHVVPIRVPSNFEGKSTPAFVKVYCCRSPVELETLEHMSAHRKESIPKVLLNLDRIKAKVETDMGSSKDMEWYNGCVWKPLTNIEALVNYQRLTSFEYMRVVPIRLPSSSGYGNPSPDIGAPDLESVECEIQDSVMDQTVETKVDDIDDETDSIGDQTVQAAVDDDVDDADSMVDQTVEAEVDDYDFDDETDSDQTGEDDVDHEGDTDSVVDQTVEVKVDDYDVDETGSVMDHTVDVKVNDEDKTCSIVDQIVEAKLDDEDETWEDDASFLCSDWEVL
jgi:hypothetical protein